MSPAGTHGVVAFCGGSRYLARTSSLISAAVGQRIAAMISAVCEKELYFCAFSWLGQPTVPLSSSSLSSDGYYFDMVARMIADVADALEHVVGCRSTKKVPDTFFCSLTNMLDNKAVRRFRTFRDRALARTRGGRHEN